MRKTFFTAITFCAISTLPTLAEEPENLETLTIFELVDLLLPPEETEEQDRAFKELMELDLNPFSEPDAIAELLKSYEK